MTIFCSLFKVDLSSQTPLTLSDQKKVKSVDSIEYPTMISYSYKISLGNIRGSYPVDPEEYQLQRCITALKNTALRNITALKNTNYSITAMYQHTNNYDKD